MKTFRIVVSAALVGAAACARQPAPRRAETSPVEAAPGRSAPVADATAAGTVERIADDYVAAYFRRFPESATAEGVEGADDAALTDHSLGAVSAWRERQREFLARLDAVDAALLPAGTSARTTRDFLKEVLEADLGRASCRMELWNVSPTWTGWQAEYAFVAGVQPVGTPEARNAALARFSALPGWIDTEIVNLRTGLAQGYSEPRVNVRAVIEQMDALLGSDPTTSPFYSPAQRDSTPGFGASLERVITEQIDPAIRRYRNFLRDEYLPRAREEIGVRANPNGAACYRAAVRYHTSLTPDAEEIHRIGLEQMERIQAEMREIAVRSFGSSDVKAVLERLRTDPRYTFASRDAELAYARAAIERARAALPEWFGIVPKAAVEVTPYPSFREKSAPGGEYFGPSDDLTRPGVYFINLYEAEKQSKAGLESTAFHETYPGHHVQIAIAKERRNTHAVQRYFGTSGFSEGWALYAERLALEMGLYSDDVARMGLLSNEALRAARMVVDPGMHMLGWSRQRAIDYVLEHTTQSVNSATSEIDRYIAVPGQATSYMLGALEIRRLRELARERMGDDFDIRDFHDRVLEDGAVTLDMLERKIERWSSIVGRRS